MAKAAAGGEPVGNVQYLTLPGTNGNYGSTPDSAANSFTGAFDFRARIAPTTWAAYQAVLGKQTSAASNSAYNFIFNGLGKPWVYWYESTTLRSYQCSTAVGFTNGTTHWVRATRNTSTNEIKFYTSDDATNDADAVSWTQLGSTVTGVAAGAMNDSTGPLLVGSRVDTGDDGPFPGKIYYVDLRSSIGGVPVAKFNSTAVTRTATRTPTTLVSTTGETWTMNGSAWDWTT